MDSGGPVVGLGSATTGDVSVGAAAGGNISYGSDIRDVLEFLRLYVWEADQRQEKELGEIRRNLAALRTEIELYQAAIRQAITAHEEVTNDRARAVGMKILEVFR